MPSTDFLSQIIPMLYIFVPLGISALVFKWWLGYRSIREKQYVREQKEQSKPENRIDNLLNNIPEIIADRKKLLSQAVDQAGPDSPMAKSLTQQISWLETLEQYKPVVDVIGKPILGAALKIVNSIGDFKI